MNEANARTILRKFAEVRPALPTSADTRWRWAEGVHVFPEAICPFCKVVMVSPHLWLVDERGRRLVQVVRIQNGRSKLMPALHPHADSLTGCICMAAHVGNSSGADSAAQALFLAIEPRSTMNGFGTLYQYGRWNEWFRDYFNHTEHDEAGLKKRVRPKLTVGRKRKTTN